MVYRVGLENRSRATDRGFESHPLRQIFGTFALLHAAIVSPSSPRPFGGGMRTLAERSEAMGLTSAGALATQSSTAKPLTGGDRRSIPPPPPPLTKRPAGILRAVLLGRIEITSGERDENLFERSGTGLNAGRNFATLASKISRDPATRGSGFL